MSPPGRAAAGTSLHKAAPPHPVASSSAKDGNPLSKRGRKALSNALKMGQGRHFASADLLVIRHSFCLDRHRPCLTLARSKALPVPSGSEQSICHPGLSSRAGRGAGQGRRAKPMGWVGSAVVLPTEHRLLLPAPHRWVSRG